MVLSHFQGYPKKIKEHVHHALLFSYFSGKLFYVDGYYFSKGWIRTSKTGRVLSKRYWIIFSKCTENQKSRIIFKRLRVLRIWSKNGLYQRIWIANYRCLIRCKFASKNN